MRPDQSGMIMLAANFFWNGLPVDVVVPVGERPKQKALDWLTRFCAQKRRLMINRLATSGSRSDRRCSRPTSPPVSNVTKRRGRRSARLGTDTPLRSANSAASQQPFKPTFVVPLWS